MQIGLLDTFMTLKTAQDIISLIIYVLSYYILSLSRIYEIVSWGQNFTWKIALWTLLYNENKSTRLLHSDDMSGALFFFPITS